MFSKFKIGDKVKIASQNRYYVDDFSYAMIVEIRQVVASRPFVRQQYKAKYMDHSTKQYTGGITKWLEEDAMTLHISDLNDILKSMVNK